MTSRNHPDLLLQKAGHGDLVETQDGEWYRYMVHLCGRALENRTEKGDRKYTLGRETAIQKVEWTEDGWLRLANGTVLPDAEVEGPDLPPHPFPNRPVRDDFDGATLDIHDTHNYYYLQQGVSWKRQQRRPWSNSARSSFCTFCCPLPLPLTQARNKMKETKVIAEARKNVRVSGTVTTFLYGLSIYILSILPKTL
ncbi:family 43 glycosylhydrolase [Paenibacillus macerans]|uniref:family 43 glycosylhydrolase n=1 Tax=Paenibacillus macerans TaxID=44252 RepID=UPI0037C5DFB4